MCTDTRARTRTQLMSGLINFVINAETGGGDYMCVHPLSFLCKVRPCLQCDGCFLRAGDLIREVAWGSAHAEVAGAQNTKTPPHCRGPIPEAWRCRPGWSLAAGAWRECGSDSAAGPAAGSVGATQRGCFLACDARRETERAKSDAESSTDPLLPSFLSSPRCQHPSLRLYFVSICSNSGFSKKPRPAISIGPLAKGCLVRGIPPQWPDPRRGLEHMARKCLCSADGYTELRCFSPSQQISPEGTSCPRKHVNSICKALLLIQFSPVPMDLTIQRILKCLLCPQLDPSACFELHKSNRLMNMVNRTCFCWFCVEEGRWDSHLCARERQTRRVTD